MIVLDASAAIELVLVTPAGMHAAERLLRPESVLAAPELLDLELVQVLRRLERRTELSRQRAAEAREDLQALQLVRYPHEPLLGRIWQLRQNLTAYDAAYIALAEALAAPLFTGDRALASAPHDAAVLLLDDLASGPADEVHDPRR